MFRIQSWNETIEAMASRLSKWKMKTLSIGGRLTLLKSVLGSMPIYHMSIFKIPMKILQRMKFIRSHFFNGSDPLAKKPTWVKWTNMLASKEKGGLGISSLYALNRALMFKWVVGGRRFGAKDQFDSLKAMVKGTSLINIRDRWIWSLQSSGDFTVASIRKLIDEFTLSEVSYSTRWIKAVPIKVDCLFSWKSKVRIIFSKLDLRHFRVWYGILDSMLCNTLRFLVKLVELKSTRHIFFTCQIARDILHLITSWWNISYMEVSSYEECNKTSLRGLEFPSKAWVLLMKCSI
ncbi:hypothetical protein Tco_0448529 [Tanacetum coccineum]